VGSGQVNDYCVAIAGSTVTSTVVAGGSTRAFGVSAGVFFGFVEVFFAFGLETAFDTFFLATFFAALTWTGRFVLVAAAVLFRRFVADFGFLCLAVVC